MSGQILGLGKWLQDFVVRYGAWEPDIRARLRAEDLELPLGGMQVSSGQDMFLTIFLQPIGVRMTSEIGVLTDFSSMILALLSLREFNCGLHQDPQINLGLLPIANRVTLAQKLV